MYPVLFDKEKIEIKVSRNYRETGDCLSDLVDIIFQRGTSPETFLWYEALSGRHFWAIARLKDTNDVISMYGLMPIDIFLQGKEIKGYLCHSVGVVPAYQGKGLFQFIGEETIRRVLGDDELIIGFPNRLALKGHKRIGWKEVGKMKFYQKKEFKKHDNSETANVYEVDKFGEEIDEFISNLGNKAGLSLKKDHRFLNWRITKPGQTYKCFVYKENDRIRGYMLFKYYCDRQNDLKYGDIIDIQAVDDSVLPVLLRKAEELSVCGQVDLLNIWTFEKSRIVRSLLGEGFCEQENVYEHSFITYANDGPITDLLSTLNRDEIMLSLADNDVF